MNIEMTQTGANDMSNPYIDNGFKNREEYLEFLSEEYPKEAVEAISDLLGPNEDFDGLVTLLQDLA